MNNNMTYRDGNFWIDGQLVERYYPQKNERVGQEALKEWKAKFY